MKIKDGLQPNSNTVICPTGKTCDTCKYNGKEWDCNAGYFHIDRKSYRIIRKVFKLD